MMLTIDVGGDDLVDAALTGVVAFPDLGEFLEDVDRGLK